MITFSVSTNETSSFCNSFCFFHLALTPRMPTIFFGNRQKSPVPAPMFKMLPLSVAMN
jgi:hypothetical protein